MGSKNRFDGLPSNGGKRQFLLSRDRLLILQKDLVELIAYRIDLRLSNYESTIQTLQNTPYYFQDLLEEKWGGQILDHETVMILATFQEKLERFLADNPLHYYAKVAFFSPEYTIVRSQLIKGIRELEADLILSGINDFTSYREYEYKLSPTKEKVVAFLNTEKNKLLVDSQADPNLLHTITAYLDQVIGEIL